MYKSIFCLPIKFISLQLSSLTLQYWYLPCVCVCVFVFVNVVPPLKRFYIVKNPPKPKDRQKIVSLLSIKIGCHVEDTSLFGSVHLSTFFKRAHFKISRLFHGHPYLSLIEQLVSVRTSWFDYLFWPNAQSNVLLQTQKRHTWYEKEFIVLSG